MASLICDAKEVKAKDHEAS